jgi:hypothetical protein
MRLRTVVGGLATALAVPLLLGGCGVLGLDDAPAPGGTATTTPGPVSGAGWVVSASGSATPSPTPTVGTGTRPPGLPPVSFLPTEPGCGAATWTVDPVLIPLTVTPGAGSLTVTWPRQYESGYRVAAVPQPLVPGGQQEYTWQTVPAGTGCTVTATIRGLTSGTAYVVWLDAPDTGHERDGARHPYSGASGVVYPK